MTEPEPRKHHKPRRRSYQERPAGQATDVDTSERLRVVGSLIIGCGVGMTWGMIAGARYYGRPFLGAIIGLVSGGVITYTLTMLLLRGTSTGLARTLMPSGRTTAYKRQYSTAEAAVARGDYSGAIAEYTKYVLEDAADPEPYLRIARIYRDKLQEYPLAISWLRRARTEGGATAGQDLLVTQDLIEIYVHKTREPRKAIPELARLVDRFPTTPAAESAKAELERLRALLKVEQDEWESLTGRFYKEREDGGTAERQDDT